MVCHPCLIKHATGHCHDYSRPPTYFILFIWIKFCVYMKAWWWFNDKPKHVTIRINKIIVIMNSIQRMHLDYNYCIKLKSPACFGWYLSSSGWQFIDSLAAYSIPATLSYRATFSSVLTVWHFNVYTAHNRLSLSITVNLFLVFYNFSPWRWPVPAETCRWF
jgi:hypothetical protein